MHDYDTAFNAGLYDVEQARTKRANRRKNSIKKKNERFEIAKDCCCFGWTVKDEIYVPLYKEQIQRVICVPIYEYIFDYTLNSYRDKQVGIKKTVKIYTHRYGEYRPIAPYLQRYSASGRKSLAKKQTNRRIRRNTDNYTIGKRPSDYKKIYDYWDTVC